MAKFYCYNCKKDIYYNSEEQTEKEAVNEHNKSQNGDFNKELFNQFQKLENWLKT